MADEVTVRQFISIRSGNLVYQPPQASFQADMTGQFGPAPGAIQVADEGTAVDLSSFTEPGWCHIYNQEPADGSAVSVGLYDPELARYYPLFRLEPGWHITFCFDDVFGSEYYPATGTGTSAATNQLYIKARDASTANVFVGVFER